MSEPKRSPIPPSIVGGSLCGRSKRPLWISCSGPSLSDNRRQSGYKRLRHSLGTADSTRCLKLAFRTLYATLHPSVSGGSRMDAMVFEPGRNSPRILRSVTPIPRVAIPVRDIVRTQPLGSKVNSLYLIAAWPRFVIPTCTNPLLSLP